MKTLYIVTKPLQFFVADIIDRKHGSTISEIIVVDMFCNAKPFFDRLKSINLMNRCFFSKNRFLSFLVAAWRKPDCLYIDGDIGTRLSLYICIFKFLSGCEKIYVYEEGIGTYRNDIYKSGLKKRILNFLGIATHFGGSFFCNGVYVFEPYKYLYSHSVKKGFEVNPIETLLKDYILDNFEVLCWLFSYDLFNHSLNNESAVLYLTSYDVKYSVIKEINNQNLHSYVKLHPHLKTNKFKTDFRNVFFIDNGIPAELVIIHLSNNFNNVLVKHQGSSVENYMKIDNVDFILV
ncbi:TPA: hypothetical protein ACMFMZ_002571 [Vibrio cholerae]